MGPGVRAESEPSGTTRGPNSGRCSSSSADAADLADRSPADEHLQRLKREFGTVISALTETELRDKQLFIKHAGMARLAAAVVDNLTQSCVSPTGTVFKLCDLLVCVFV